VTRTVWLAAGAAAVLLATRPAAAYVRYVSNSGKVFQWPQSCVVMTHYPSDLVGMMTRDEINGAVEASAKTWSKSSDACTYLDIQVSSSSDPTPRAVNDGRNNIIFRSTSWCKQMPGGECDPTMPYDPAALALTSVSASTSSGIIRDADLEVNAYRFSWADLVKHSDLRGDGQSFHDLQNAVTHEMGHVIGLDHTCYLQPPPLIDNSGQPTPDCASAPPDVLATTMFPSANPGDVDKRDLAPDDQLAVCEIYPAAQDPMVCAPGGTDPKGCACTTGGPATPGLASFVLAAALLLIMRGRRRRAG
jgi:MYXO-CTERM domain-containing protein